MLEMVKEVLGKMVLLHGLIGENLNLSGFSLNFRKKNLIWKSWNEWQLIIIKFYIKKFFACKI